ncbi:glutamate synthase-related protein [Legionella nagasakiensis]|uniref:glutamate synthase-related protein n=1 Tax=Legionella nagasakiensis TaxID=535290 RepID=UPI001F5FDCCF|nr:glutamate synthase-related protein [Legionella nagasakiensis]
MWVYEAAKNTDTTIGFGTTRDHRPINTIYFVDSPFPVLKRDVVKAHAITVGETCKCPYTTNSLINISAMSYGSISENAILALSHGAKKKAQKFTGKSKKNKFIKNKPIAYIF